MKDFKEIKIKIEDDSNNETENFKFESVIIKGEPSEASSENVVVCGNQSENAVITENAVNYLGNNAQKTDEEQLLKQDVIVQEERDIFRNVYSSVEENSQTNDELKYGFDVVIKEEPKDNFDSNENYTKQELNDSSSSFVQTEEINNAPPPIPTCPLCLTTFPHPWQLDLHRHLNCNDRPFKCTLCDKTFSDHSALSRHIKSHSDLKPYTCDICQKSFKQSGHLAGHKLIHSGIKAYKCDLCGKMFGRTDRLNAHKRSHLGDKPFKCEICEKAFYDNSILIRHIRTHFTEKAFKCEDCGKSFSENSSLTKHRRTHTNERPFGCELCGKRFRQSAHLVGHKKTHKLKT